MKKSTSAKLPIAEAQKVNWNTLASYFIVVALAFIFYASAFENDVALDDVMVLSNNTFVQQGVEGIPDILAHDSFYGATHKPATQLGWRYRPLSLVLFAICYEFFGADWSIYHMLSVLLYALSAVVAFSFLNKSVFAGNPLLSLVTTSLFIIHPVHVEVVANIKSCDELLAFLFTILTISRFMSWQKNGNRKTYYGALFFFLLALFSKESTVLIVGLIPILLFIDGERGFRPMFSKTIPFILLTGIFVAIRLSISSIPEIENNIPTSPYLLATVVQKMATVTLVLGEYLRLLFYPSPLIFDYGYNHIPYTDFGDWRVVLSLLLHTALMASAIWLIYKKRIEGFFLLTYLAGILLLSNLIINVGPMLAERFLFTPSFFFLVAFVALLNRLLINTKNKITQGVMMLVLVIVVSFSYLTVAARTKEWKDNQTLYAADLKKAPNSFRVQAFNGMTLVSEAGKMSDSLQRINTYQKSIAFFEKAYRIYPNYKMMFKDWGYSYYCLGKIDSAAWAWQLFRKLNPSSQYNKINDQLLANAHFKELMAEYNAHYREGNLPYLKTILSSAVSYLPDNTTAWTTLGKVYLLNGQRDSARFAWQTVIQIDSTNSEARSLLLQY